MIHAIFDSELVGKTDPKLLVCIELLETSERYALWYHKRGHMKRLVNMLMSPEYTWVGFNSIKFDMSIIAAATDGVDPFELKAMASELIQDNIQPWMTEKRYNYAAIEGLDHIDLFEVAPGVMISLKIYMGRLGCKTLQDMPIHHDTDITARQEKLIESYCWNDVEGTKLMFERLQTQLKLRASLSKTYGVDLRSKSDAQCAEAIFKERLGITRSEKIIPRTVEYRAPAFIQSKSDVVNALIDALEEEHFEINRANGAPVEPAWMETPVALGSGTYKVGLGGLHSTHDKALYVMTDDDMLLSDFDVGSYYPNIIMKAGIVPALGGDKGARFLKEYEEIYQQRITAKKSGNKVDSNSLKILLNGTFGKLGSIYSAFYAPDLLLAVTLTGQLNLLCLIYELERIKGVKVLSANTDGIIVHYPAKARERVLKVFTRNSKVTGFDYEETPYRCVAMKDVNNYMAVTTDNEIKSKGLYASNRPEENPLYLMKNPTMEVCSRMARDYLLYGWLPEDSLAQYTDMSDFVAIRNVKGGGVQHLCTKLVDDWVLIEDHDSAQNVWWSEHSGKTVKRKSRPHAYEIGVGGVPFGRVARWYMTTSLLPPITYVDSGNKVPKTDGAKLCMVLPDTLPPDLDRDWYVAETYSMLRDMGVAL